MTHARINAEGGPLSIGPDGSVSMILYTGAPIFLAGWVHPKTKQPTPVVLDVAGLELPTGRTPILMGHDTDRRVGWADPGMISIDAGTVRVAGATRIAGPDADKLAADSAAGFPFQASIGAEPIDAEFFPDGTSTEVNGRLMSGPVWVVHKSRYTEGSVVVFGADNATAAMVASKEETTMPEGTPKTVKAASVDVAALQELMGKYPGKESVIMTALAAGKTVEDVASALEIVGQSEGEMATEMEAKDTAIAAMKVELATIKAQLVATAKVEAEKGAAPAKLSATAKAEKSDEDRWPHLVKAMRDGRVKGIGNFTGVKYQN